jgi:hydrogenase expression/formation protein HypC
MCLGIPMQVMAVDGYLARCSAKGVEREVSLFLVQDDPPRVGDFVVVHVGYAIQKTTPQEARSAWEIYDRILAAEGAEATDA